MRRQSEQVRSPLKHVESLQSFKLNYHEKASIYHHALAIPQFLVDNLKSQHRVIKEFTGQDAILRAFYFNLMKLAFQLQNQETDYARLVEDVLIGEEEFGDGELQDKNFSDKQYRSFLKEFIELLEEQEIPNFEETVQFYPIVDEILLKMFKQLVPFTLKLRDRTDFEMARRIFEYLSKKFKIKMQVISGCFKFLQSDIFVYVSNASQVYLIFMDQLAFIKEVTEEASSCSASQMNQSNTSMNRNNLNTSKMVEKTQIKNVQNGSRSNKRVFTTVINMLDSKKSPSGGSSIEGRNSIEEDLDKLPCLFDRVSDRVTEKEGSSVQEYSYTTPINRKDKNAPTTPAWQLQNINPMLQSQNSAIIKHNNRLSSLSQSIQDRSSTLSNQLSLSSLNRSQSPQSPNRFQLYRDTMLIQKMAKTSGYAQDGQKLSPRNIPLGNTYNSESIPTESDHKVEKQDAKNTLQDQQELKSPTADISKKPVVQLSRNNSKKLEQIARHSNLQTFNINTNKNSIPEPKNSITQSANNRVLPKKEPKQKQNDDSYQKFTHSALLQILDEQYKVKIRQIKKKFREQRTPLKLGL